MSHSILSAIRRSLGDERGLALPYALGVTMVLSALAAGIFSYTTMNQGAAKRQAADQRAYGLAETGLSYALSTLQSAGPTYTLVPALSGSGTTVALTGGTTRYWGSLSGTTWTLNASGTVYNPTGPGTSDVVRNVSLQALITTTTTGDTRPYDYLFVDQPSGCFTIQNTVTIETSLYVRGNLCLENNSLISAPAVHVLGNVNVNSSQASVGTSAKPIPDFSITGACYRNGALTLCPVSVTSRVWAGAYGINPPTIAKPSLDLPYWYANADLGPNRNCTTGTFPGGFDNDSTMNVSRGQINLTPNTGYDCYTGPAGAPTAQIKWTPGSNPSNPGTLNVKGTIFFDADIMWENLSLIQYDGRATIFIAGKMTLKNQTNVCGVTACDATWDPSQDFLAMVVGSRTPSGMTPDSVLIDNFTKFQGAIYAVNDYTQGNNSTVWGPVIARHAYTSNSSVFKPLPNALGGLPPGVPTSTTTITTVTAVPGSYAG